MNIDEINDKLNTEIRKRDELVVELEAVSRNLLDLLDKRNRLDPKMAPIVCPQCNGIGRVKTEEGKKVICPTCRGECYYWGRVFIPEKKKNE